MSANTVSISVESDSLADVTASLGRCLGAEFSSGHFLNVAGINILVLEVGAEVDYEQRFLAENGIRLDPPWDRLDPRLFKIDIQLSAALGGVGASWRDALGDAAGRFVSRELTTRVVVSLDNGSIPFRLYERGTMTEEYKTQYAAYFASREWVPRSLLPGS